MFDTVFGNVFHVLYLYCILRPHALCSVCACSHENTMATGNVRMPCFQTGSLGVEEGLATNQISRPLGLSHTARRQGATRETDGQVAKTKAQHCTLKGRRHAVLREEGTQENNNILIEDSRKPEHREGENSIWKALPHKLKQIAVEASRLERFRLTQTRLPRHQKPASSTKRHKLGIATLKKIDLHFTTT